MSLRVRLVLATIVVALAALVAAGVATNAAFSRSQLHQTDDTLQRTHEPIEQTVAARPTDLELDIERIAPGTFVALQRADGTFELAIPAREPGHQPVSADLVGLTRAGGTTVSTDATPTFATVRSTTNDTDVRVRISRLVDGRVLIIGESLHERAESRHQLVVIELIVAAIALLFAGLVGALLMHVGLRPLRRVEHTALLIAEAGDLEHQVPGASRSDEVGRLAVALNTMLGRIRAAFAERDATEVALRGSEARMRRFVADVSHELRTPLTAVSAYAELFGRGARNRPDDLARAMHGIDVEAARMHVLVEELLLLANLDEGRPLQRRPVDLGQVVVEAVAAATAVAPQRRITLDVADGVVVDGDRHRLRQIIDNLLANVRTHTPPATTTAVSVAGVGDAAVVVVGDDGPGMPPDQAAHIFERFYRADPSRARTSGGSGLGMAIVDALVTAHSGTIHASAVLERGLTITIELPLRAPTARTTDESPHAAGRERLRGTPEPSATTST